MRRYPETIRPDVFGKRPLVMMCKPYAGFPRSRLASQEARRIVRRLGAIELPPRLATTLFVAAGAVMLLAFQA